MVANAMGIALRELEEADRFECSRKAPRLRSRAQQRRGARRNLFAQAGMTRTRRSYAR